MDTSTRSYGPGFWPAAIAEKTVSGISPHGSRGIAGRAEEDLKELNNVDNAEEDSSDTSEDNEEPSGVEAAAGDGEHAEDGDREEEEGVAEEADGDGEVEQGERVDADIPEEAPIKVKRDPAMPTAEERQKHDIAHLPPRP